MPTRIPERADVIVVGAGTAGAVAARRAAMSGARVLLVEKVPAADVGRKVCGNAITRDGIAAIQKRVSPPSGAEIAMRVEAGEILLPEGRVAISVLLAGLVLNRLVFGQRLLRDALDAGVELIDRCSCVGWADRDGVKIRVRFDDRSEADATAGIVIDASGYRGVLTRSGGPSHPDTLARSEVGIGYREIVLVEEPLEPPHRVKVILSPEGAEEGYGWIFPMGRTLVNAGVGAPIASGTGAMKRAFARFRERDDVPAMLEAVDEGTGMLPLRPPLASMVGRGFLSVGDAACHANPLHGGGIASSIIGGALAGETAARALSRRAATASELWGYGVAVMREIGSIHAAHNVLRWFIRTLAPRDVAFLGEALSRVDAFTALTGPKPGVAAAELVRVLAGTATRPGLALSLIRASRLMDGMRKLYEAYPETPERLDGWRRRERSLARSVDAFARGGNR